MGFSGEASNPQNQKTEQLKCPRCSSTNTKFCYFNNYSRSQPRHFCKSCKRHWTAGGTLRNVPIGGCRKANRRAKSSSRTSPSKENIEIMPSSHLPELINPGEDFGLSFPLFLNFMGPEELLQPPEFEFSSSSSSVSSGCWGSCWDDLAGLFSSDDAAAGISGELPSLS